MFLGVVFGCVTLGYAAQMSSTTPSSFFTFATIVGSIIGFVLSSSPETAASMAAASTPHEANPVSASHAVAPVHAAPSHGTAPASDKDSSADAGARAFRDQNPGSSTPTSTLPALKHLLGTTAVFFLIVAALVSYSHSSVVNAAAAANVPKVFAAPTKPLPVISGSCAGKLNDGQWSSLEGLPAGTAKLPIDVLQIGLTETSERVWKWSFDANKACGFGVKSAKDVASAVRGRWLLFAGDSQIRLVFRRLTDSVSHLLTKESGPPTINGVVETNPAEYPFFGHKDFEVQWTEQTKKGPIVTRLSFWWTPFMSNMTEALTGEGPEAASRASRCSAGGSATGLPDATILGAGSWDALYFHDTAHLTAESHGLLEALSSRGSSPLCDRAPGSPAVDTPLPAVYWINQPRPVRSRLKTEEKRQYLTEHSMVESNKAVAEVPADKSPFAAVIDLYEVSKSRGWDAADGVHYGDSLYNVAFQMFANAALGPATPMRCSTCKPTLTSLPGDPVLGLLSGVLIGAVSLFFLLLKQYVTPSIADDSLKAHLGAP